MSRFNFKAITALRGHHEYKETASSDAKLNDKGKIKIETKVQLLSIHIRAQLKQSISILMTRKPLVKF